ncbi:autotransporter assembly complex protein TamA [Stakelama tenebrarum]|uniref:BamA/TamA family outer membrane protein n=1 Tax=Stakelama tenebrarum TaxID=2711215 RepID=A0A6G6Y5M8_9SPHN|nr:BamA/TamA family outer membrane protein [Sphingosinithalassobacter tenebrarum]QIG80151.1 BamA/TamA family outer membrane protein [Sphingosinithalassobacter tenebrarum]
MTGSALLPQIALAQDRPDDGPPVQEATADDVRAQDAGASDPQGDDDDSPIIDEERFEESMPQIGDDIDAPLEPLPDTEPMDPAGDPAIGDPETIPPVEQEDPEFGAPLTPLAAFEVDPPESIEGVEEREDVTIRYDIAVRGFDETGLEDRFRELSALEEGDGEAANATMVAARAEEDEKLAERLLQSVGYYDGTAVASIEQTAPNSGKLRVTLDIVPGPLYTLGSITIDSRPTEPAGLIDAALPLKNGHPIDAARVQAAEANVSLRLPQQGYPFIRLLQRDVLLDSETHTGAYTLPVRLGPRASFGSYRTEPAGEDSELAFDADHVGVLARFERGELFDSRKVDDLREALIATGLFSTVAVEPVRTGETAPDGTEYVDLMVRQDAGPPRTLAVEGGYATGQGIRVEGSWTHRNLFPPEGALILSGVGGTQEQGLSATFRRSNAGRRDRTFSLTASADHSDYDAYESFTGTLSGRISFESTPIWQKRWTYYYGAELVGSNEDRYNFNTGSRDRGTWLIAALPAFVGFDTSDDLLNPTRGFRIKLNLSPETSVRGAARPYVRGMLEGTAYYPLSDGLVIAGRARVGTIAGIERNDLPPSRRYYAGGGGSVRGFGYQELGPRAPDGRPIGGRSLNEFAIEARYRFGNFGIVPFVDAGQVYESITPQFSDIRFGAGIGGRFYTNFGPLRVDVATPINRKPGESRISLYISIGQAF